MATNWSVILNVLLLLVVIVAIGRMLKAKREQMKPAQAVSSSPVGPSVPFKYPPTDDIIAVRKVELHELRAQESTVADTHARPKIPPLPDNSVVSKAGAQVSHLMLFLSAKSNRVLAGYELLQSILVSGFRFGEGQIFHRHQFPHGKGPVLCSLATATADGTFDLQNIGAFSVRGLCLFMQTSGNSLIDQERFTIMYETAKQLSESLDTNLLDEQRKLFTEESFACVMRFLGVSATEVIHGVI